MDFSRLHTYTPPQCVPENTGYTYALSSSYSSDALDFEIEHKIDPVFDSPRMSRRSLRLAAAGVNKPDSARSDILHDSSYSGSLTFREQSSNMVKQRKSINKQSGSVRAMPRKNLSSSPIFNQSSFLSRASDTSMVSTVLDESSIREQTEVDHFWGSDATLLQRNGDIATAETQTTMINGYTCSDCSMLSERKEVLTAYSASSGPSSRIYSRDRSQRHASRGTYFYMSKILRLVKHTAASLASLLVQLFQMVLLKQSYESKGTFSVVFLGFHTKPVCIFFVLFLLDFFYGTMVFICSPGWLLFFYLLLFFNSLTCATLCIFFFCFQNIKIQYVRNISITVKIHVLISFFFFFKLRKGRICFSELFCVTA
ncbi:SUN domain-containing protein 1-like isoform X2 [Meleagris gallopavo]|uniref:SUN domain-containing protein 1-like isoform X2 n=1 Tax=Meleagris gallopavo TaxID=9103 RepID=UPI00093C9F79|nr:SUN domain-containing protein 1-like isoform X2 [Meleagris gallopavo]